MNLIPKNWSVFQHYKDRNPPWIKLHRNLLENRDFVCLPLASKALVPLLWLLASESKTGEFLASTEELEFRLRISKKDIESGLKPLIDKGFFIVASGVLAKCLHVDRAETEGERETEGETKDNGFALFWSTYPKKTAKPAAEKAFKSARINGHLSEVIADIEKRKSSNDWQKEGGKYIPNPATFLNQRRWEDGGGDQIDPIGKFI